MAEPRHPTQVQSLNGPVQNLSQNAISLPSRPSKGTSSSSKDSVPPPGSSLTGKQEHCKTSSLPSGGSKTDNLALHRPQTRAHIAASRLRNQRTSFYYSFTEVRCSVQVRVWRGCPCRFRSSTSPVHICPSCTEFPFLGPGKRKGVLAG